MNSATARNNWRTIAGIAVLLLAGNAPGNLDLSSSLGVSVASAQDVQASDKTRVPDWGLVDWDNWETLDDLLNNIREVSSMPAIAAAVVRDSRILDNATVGVRDLETMERVTPDDPFHIGSVTKSMTACVIAKLVEDGAIDWTTTVASVLPDITMREAYRNVTIEQLLHHQGGVPSWVTASDEDRELWHEQYPGTATEQRAAFLARLLQLEPVGIAGQTSLYSNAGYALAGLMAERITGQTWEALIQTNVFDPLQMTTASFGHPGTAALPRLPRGHYIDNGQFVPLPDEYHPTMSKIAPAGNVHCSSQDLARYAIFHLNGLGGADAYLRAETIARLHALPPHPDKLLPYASGWYVRSNASGETVHLHGGTTGSFYAELRLFPESSAAVVVLTNVGRETGELVANKVSRALMARYGSDSKATFAMGATPGGQWTSNTVDSVQFSTGEATASDDIEAWRVVKQLSETINNEDRDAYMDLFAKKDPSHESVFEFMAGVLATRGNILSFHDLSPPIDIPDSTFPIRTVTFHLENGYPGYIGISLDEAGKIDHFSLFVKSDICPNGPDTQCDKVTRTLGDF